MSTIPVLWPELKVDAVTPAAVLRVQAASLEKLTQGILLGRVVGGGTDNQAYLHLDVAAPALGTTLRIVTITHRKGFPYPATLQWLGQPQPTAIERTIRSMNPLGAADTAKAQASDVSSDDELEALLETVFRSPAVKSAIYSLLARSNDLEPEVEVRVGDDHSEGELNPSVPVVETDTD